MQSNQPLESHINKDTFQVFLCYSLCSVPLSFAIHPWFVVNKKGTVSRWEVNYIAGKGQENYGYLAKNAYNLDPFVGINIFPYSDSLNLRWSPGILGMTEGDENSIAKKMIDFIESSHANYAYGDGYRFRGPNSNTYAQWVLGHFPEFKAELPWNAIGKGYK